MRSPASPSYGPRRSGVWLLALLVVVLVINVPLGWTLWTRHQLDQHGLTTEGIVSEDPERTVAVPEDDPRAWYVAYRLPRELDAEQRLYSTEVDRQAFEEATETRRIELTFLPGHPERHVVEGQVVHRLGYVMVGFADLALLAMALLYVFVGRRQAKDLLLEALADVERCPPSWTMTDLGDDEWLITGEVVELFDDGLALETRDGKRVLLRLGEFHSEVGHQQPARVWGREVSSF